MYNFRQFHETANAERIARATFYSAALDAQTAQKASRRADSHLLSAALDWASTIPDIPPCPDVLKPWAPDRPDALPLEPPSGAAGKEAAQYFRTICQHLECWPRSADGTPVGPESVSRRPSAATVEFLNGLPTDEADVIRALASAAVRFGDRTRQKAASGNRKRKAEAEAGQAEGTNASGSRKAEGAETGQAENKTGDKPDFSGLDPLAAAAAALKWAAEAAREAASLAAKAADSPAAPDTVKEAASFAAKAEKLAAKAASLAGMQ